MPSARSLLSRSSLLLAVASAAGGYVLGAAVEAGRNRPLEAPAAAPVLAPLTEAEVERLRREVADLGRLAEQLRARIEALERARAILRREAAE